MESYKNKKISIEKRIEDLLSRMTLKEKIAQLSCLMPHMVFGENKLPSEDEMISQMNDGIGRMTQTALPFFESPSEIAKFTNGVQKFALEKTRLGIPVIFQNESLNGVTAVKATCFPSPINIASSWEPELVEKMAEIISNEMNSVGLHIGLSPVLDVAHDARWGRVYETFGEDPYLISEMGLAYVKGLQKNKNTLACAKHFLGYGATDGGLNMATIHTNKRELFDIYAKPFDAVIKNSDLDVVMVTYSEIDGVPISINKEIVQGLLRNDMNYDGSILCDGGSISFCVTKQKVAKDFKEAAILALETGLDAETPTSHCYAKLVDAVEQGEVDIALVDRSVRHILKEKFELGLFENPYVNENNSIEIFNTKESAKLAKEMAEKSIVLLKNEKDVLPLSNKTKSIALIGPHANNLRNMFTGYSFLPASQEMFMHLINNLSAQGVTFEGIVQAISDPLSSNYLKLFESFDREMRDIDEIIIEQYPNIKTLKEALEITFANTKINFEQGCGLIDGSQEQIDSAVEAAKKSDVIIVALGEKCGWVNATVGEGKDKTNLQLPEAQQKLLAALKTLNKPIIVTLFHGRPLSIQWMEENVDAILDCGYPGQEGSLAIADIIAGNVNPSGKLPMTVPKNVGQIPIYYNQKVGSSLKRNWNPNAEKSSMKHIYKEGYVDGNNAPLYPFGYGLSYTNFEYSDLKVEDTTVPMDGKIQISFTIKNIGNRSGIETAQLYFYDKEARVTRPIMELIGFEKVTLEPKEQCQVFFEVDVDQLCFTNHNYQTVVEPGNIDIMVGSNSENIHLFTELTLVGEEKIIPDRKKFFSKSWVN